MVGIESDGLRLARQHGIEHLRDGALLGEGRASICSSCCLIFFCGTRFFSAATAGVVSSATSASSVVRKVCAITGSSDTGTRRRPFSQMWMLDAGLAPEDAVRKAGPHLEELLRRYPDNPRARLFELMRDGARDGRVERARMEAWLLVADPADPLQKRMIDDIKAALEP